MKRRRKHRVVTHIVFWNVRNDEKKQENMEHMKEFLTALVGKVDGLLSAEVGFNFNPKGYDLALYSTFESKAALDAYDVHPADDFWQGERFHFQKFRFGIRYGDAGAVFLRDFARRPHPEHEVRQDLPVQVEEEGEEGLPGGRIEEGRRAGHVDAGDQELAPPEDEFL